MPFKVHPIQSSFSRGEWSPTLEGRVDLEGYKDSAHEITNWIIKVQGGLLTRGGWHFVAETKDSTKESRLIPMQYSELQNYIIEIGDEYMRFFMDSGQIESGGVPYEIVSPYYDTDIWEIRYGQDDRILYLVHPDVQRQRLDRYSHTSWVISELKSLDGPYMDEVLDVTITPSATTGFITMVAIPVISTTNLIINGTFAAPADECAGGTPTADTYLGAGYEATKAYDDNAATAWYSGNTVGIHWVQYQLPLTKIIKQYSITVLVGGSEIYAPKDFKLQGSTDGISWIDLDVQIDVTDWAISPTQYFNIPNLTTYLYYRIYVTANNGGTVSYPGLVSIAEIQLSTEQSLGGTWVFGTGWTYDGGTLKADHDIAGTGELSQVIEDIVAGFEYKVVFTTSNVTAGSVQAKIGGTLGTARLTSATFTEYFTAADVTGLSFVPTNDFRGSIDSVEVYLIESGTGIFLPGHVGSVFAIRHTTTTGRVRIDIVTDGLHASGTVLATLGGAGASTGYKESSWSEQNGYPKLVTFDEGRTLYIATYEQPQTWWASKTFNPNVFTPGTDAADTYSFTLSTQRIIRWMKKGRLLGIGCMSGEVTAIGPSDAPISATSPPVIRDETNHGSASLEPLKINKAIIFLQEAEKKIREFSYKYEDDAYSAHDLTVLADHLFEEGVIDWAYQQEPYSIIWVLTADGILRGCTYNRETNTVGWFTCETDGEIESVAVIPYSGKDQLWAIIKRTINGIDKRYIEYFDWNISLDSALTYSGAPITTVSGLTHLIGQTVSIIADGAYAGDQVVNASGQVTLETAASVISVGLPFTPTLVTSRPEVSLPNGTSQGRMKRWSEIWLRLINSMGLTVNGEVIPARSTDDLMGSAPDPYTGDFRVDSLGWDRNGRITIVQTLPMSSEISAFFGKLEIGDD
jgi:hypothetical protein